MNNLSKSESQIKQQNKSGSNKMVFWILGIIGGLIFLIFVLPVIFIYGLDRLSQSKLVKNEYKPYSWDRVYFTVGQQYIIKQNAATERKIVLIVRPIVNIPLCKENNTPQEKIYKSSVEEDKVTIELLPTLTGGDCTKMTGGGLGGGGLVTRDRDPRYVNLIVPMSHETKMIEILENDKRASFKVLLDIVSNKIKIESLEKENVFAVVPFTEIPVVGPISYVYSEKDVLWKDLGYSKVFETLTHGLYFSLAGKSFSDRTYVLNPVIVNENYIIEQASDDVSNKNSFIVSYEWDDYYKKAEEEQKIGFVSKEIINPIKPDEIFADIKEQLVNPADIQYIRIVQYFIDGTNKILTPKDLQ